MAGASMKRETVYRLLVHLDGETDPALLNALKQTRQNFDQINVGGTQLSKTFLQMGQQGNLSFGSLLEGVNLVQSGAVSANTAFASFGIGIAAALGSAAVKGAIDLVKWGLRETVDIIKEGVDEAASLETVMMNVAKVTPGIRAEDGGYTALYGQYEADIRQMGIDYATLGYEGIGEIYAQGARGGIGKDMTDEDRRLALQEYASQTAMQAVAWEVDPRTTGMITRDWRTKLGMDEDEVSRVADLINYLENTNNADAGAMAEFVTKVGALSGGMNIPIDQIAMLSTLWGVGGFTGDASKLSTDMNAMLTRMASGGGQQRAMFQTGAKLIGYTGEPGELGPADLSREFGKDPFNTMVSVLRKINELENVDEQVSAARGLFGQGATESIWTLLNNLDNIDPMLEDIASGAYRGSVAEEYGYLEDTYAFKKEQFEQIWGNFLIQAGQPFMEGLKEVWDEHGEEIIARIPDVAAGFSNLADVVFRPGGLADKAIDLLPKALTIFEWFLSRLVDWAEHPLANLLGSIPGLGKGFDGLRSIVGELFNLDVGQYDNKGFSGLLAALSEDQRNRDAQGRAGDLLPGARYFCLPEQEGRRQQVQLHGSRRGKERHLCPLGGNAPR